MGMSILCRLLITRLSHPRGNRVIVVADNGATAVLGPLHINSVIDQPNGE